VPRYVVERMIEPETFSLGPKLSQKALRLIDEQFGGLAWVHSHIVEADDSGKVRTFCIYDSPNEQMLIDHAAAIGGHKVLNVYPLAGDVDPGDIPAEGEPTSDSYFS
jgi:hypothetical protein